MPRRFYLPPPQFTTTVAPSPGRTWGSIAATLVMTALLLLLVVVLRTYLGDDGWFDRGRRPLPAARVPLGTTTAPDNAPVLSRVIGDSAVPTAAGAEVSNGQETSHGASPALLGGSAIRLQVLNGCGVKGLTREVTPALRAKGFDVRESRNAGRFDYTQTVVIARTGKLELAATVADSLGLDGSRVSAEASRSLVDIDVTLIVGADYRTLRLNSNPELEE